jgi:DnaB-like helicase N terminal domain
VPDPIPFTDYRGRETPRPGPFNVELEQSFLGALLMDNGIFNAVAAYLKPDHFVEEIHRRIFSVAASMISQGRVASPVTLKTFLGDHDVGGGVTVPQYLAQLIAEAPPAVSGRDYGRAIHDLASRRAIIVASRAAIEQASDAPRVKLQRCGAITFAGCTGLAAALPSATGTPLPRLAARVGATEALSLSHRVSFSSAMRLFRRVGRRTSGDWATTSLPRMRAEMSRCCFDWQTECGGTPTRSDGKAVRGDPTGSATMSRSKQLGAESAPT